MNYPFSPPILILISLQKVIFKIYLYLDNFTKIAKLWYFYLAA